MDILTRIIVCLMVLFPMPRPPMPRPEEPKPVIEVAESVALRGQATWYRWREGEAAAGPALREALGPSWRGRTVKVCVEAACVSVRLTDFCQCHKGTDRERVIDLDRDSFARLAPPSRGVIEVVLEWQANP